MLITSTEQLTSEYLTDLLANRDLLAGGEVVGVDIKLEKKLHASIVARVELILSPDAGPAAPKSLFLKMSGPKVVTGGLDNEKEVAFYQHIAGEMPDPPFIECYDAKFSDGLYHLILSDLSDTHFQPESPQAPNETQSLDAVAALAELHAFWWEHPGLGNEIGTLFDQEWLTRFLDDIETSVTAFIAFMGDRLSPDRRRTYERLIAARREIWGRLTDPHGLTVTHGDAHWWNFLYPHDVERDRVRIFDWQLWHIDVGARDLAFLIALGGFAERRPALEHPLVEHYYQTLISHGVNGYAFTDLWEDYRWAAVRNLNIPVIFWLQGRPEALWSQMLERAFLSFDDLKCTELAGF